MFWYKKTVIKLWTSLTHVRIALATSNLEIRGTTSTISKCLHSNRETKANLDLKFPRITPGYFSAVNFPEVKFLAW